MERCPFCGGQLISCDCCYDKLYPGHVPSRWDDEIKQHVDVKPFNGLPEDVYNEGLPPDKAAEWEKLLNEKGLIPYIRWPNLCARCGEHFPEMFKVSDEEWAKYIEPRERRKMVCRPCFDWIKKAIDEAAAKRA